MKKDDDNAEPIRTTVGTFKLADVLNAPARNVLPLHGEAAPTINFAMSPSDQLLVADIVRRIAEVAKQHGFTAQLGYMFDAQIAAADIANVHCNGTPLHLLRWLMADQLAFMEDYAGIVRHVNRVRGGLNGEWKPRFAVTMQ